MKIVFPTPENIRLAAEALQTGQLIGMPTETVYGLAANALNADAVRATFAAKGRPADNPLIVHLASVEDVSSVALEVPDIARRLAAEFWPGPLTLVLPKRPEVPDVTTGGLDSVALRVPGHPVARELIRVAGVPVSAPSANPFMGLSPTRAADLDPAILEHVALVLDGGPCEVGLESTVVDVRDGVRLLRPGHVSREMLENLLGETIEVGPGKERRSPGLYPRHYAPGTTVRLVVSLAGAPGVRFGGVAEKGQIALPDDPAGYGSGLYAALKDLDRRGLAEILIESPPTDDAWAAVWDRLKRMV